MREGQQAHYPDFHVMCVAAARCCAHIGLGRQLDEAGAAFCVDFRQDLTHWRCAPGLRIDNSTCERVTFRLPAAPPGNF